MGGGSRGRHLAEEKSLRWRWEKVETRVKEEEADFSNSSRFSCLPPLGADSGKGWASFQIVP